MEEEPVVNNETPNDGTRRPPQWLIDLLVWAGKDPWEFLVTVMLILAPFFMISAFLAYKLSKMIEAKEKEEKKATRRAKQINKKLKRTKAD